MSEQEKETENPNEIIDIVEKILGFNTQLSGQGLKILTPSQDIIKKNLKMKSENYCIPCTDKKTYKKLL